MPTHLRDSLLAAALVAASLAGLSAGCARKPRVIGLATTTSTENSGLLDALLPAFTRRHGVEVQVIAVGTGRAIRHGEAGDVDVILVHARAAEDRFVAEGFGVSRRDVMWNDFVILGPAADPSAEGDPTAVGDPAGVRGMRDAAAALARIAKAKAAFVSRGDESGTHRKEQSLWRAAGVVPPPAVEPSGSWYLSAGQGMGACLTVADEKRAYVLADRGTYLAYREKLDLEVLVEGDPRLVNPYGVIAVDPARHPHVDHEAAMLFVDWLTSPEAQGMIAGYRRGDGPADGGDPSAGGEQLFHPCAVVRPDERPRGSRRSE